MNPQHLPRWARTPWTKAVAVAATGVLTLGAVAACTPDVATSTNADSASTSAVSATSSVGKTAAEVLAENLDASETVALTESIADAADAVAIDLGSPTAADGVEVDGDTVTITAPGTYVLSGTLAGQVTVDSSDDGVVRLVLDGADITSSTGAAIDVRDADQVSVVLADGSTNRLEDADEYAESDEDNAANAALYSTADLAISGSGALEVVGNANDGITGKDGLVVAGGDITVTAADDAVRGKDYLVVSGGTLDLTAGGDGLKSDADDDATAGYVALLGGEVTVAAGSDGVQGFTDVAIVDGTLTVTESEEGIEAAVIAVSGGDVDLTSTDDALNATVKEAEDETPEESEGGGAMAVQEGASLTITGGTVHAVAGTDGLDSNGVVEISGGTTVVEAAGSGSADSGQMMGGGGEGAIDANGSVNISGGTVVTSGNATTGSVEVSNGWASFEPSVAAGATVEIAAADGSVLATVELTRETSAVGFTADGLVAGEEYTVLVDGEEVGTATAEAELAGGMGGGPGGRGQAPTDGQMPGGGNPPEGGTPPEDGQMPGAATDGTTSGNA
jgi:hypothetical protein